MFKFMLINSLNNGMINLIKIIDAKKFIHIIIVKNFKLIFIVIIKSKIKLKITLFINNM